MVRKILEKRSCEYKGKILKPTVECGNCGGYGITAKGRFCDYYNGIPKEYIQARRGWIFPTNS